MFYTYVYRDPRPHKNSAVVYVGKGQDETERAMAHWRKPHQCHNPGLRHLLLLLLEMKLEPVIQILATFESEKEALDKECELIALFGRRDLKTGTLFNLTAGGEGWADLGPEVMARRNASIKTTFNTDETKALQGGALKQRWQDPAYRQKQLERMHTLAADPAYRERLSVAITEAHADPEVRAKISVASKEHWGDENYRAKRSKSLLDAVATPEHKERRGSATKLGWANKETRAKRIAGIKASRTPELRAQIGASCKALWTDDKKKEQSEKMKQALDNPETRQAKSDAMKAVWARRKCLTTQ